MDDNTKVSIAPGFRSDEICQVMLRFGDHYLSHEHGKLSLKAVAKEPMPVSNSVLWVMAECVEE